MGFLDRYVAGDRGLATALIDLIRGLEQDYFQVLWGMAKAATDMKLALEWLAWAYEANKPQ